MELRRSIHWLAPVALVVLSTTSVSARQAGLSGRLGSGVHFRAGHFRTGAGYFPFYPGHYGYSDRHFRLDQRRRHFIHRTRPFVRGRPVFTSRVLSPIYYPPYYPAHYFDPYLLYPQPPVIIIDGDRESEERRGDDGYYLDPDRRGRDEAPRDEPRAREGVPGLLIQHLRIEIAEPGTYRVQWTGPASDLAAVSYRSLGKEKQTLDLVQPKEPPFRGLLRVPEATTAVEVSIQYASGGSAVLQLPVAEFKRLVGEKRRAIQPGSQSKRILTSSPGLTPH